MSQSYIYIQNVYLFIYTKTYYKELAHVITEADEPRDLQGESASWRPRSAGGGVP